jgi:hypothetical protein
VLGTLEHIKRAHVGPLLVPVRNGIVEYVEIQQPAFGDDEAK